MNGTETTRERFERIKVEKAIRIKAARRLRKALTAKFLGSLSEVREEIANGEHLTLAAKLSGAYPIFRFSMERARKEVDSLLRHCCESEFDKALQDMLQRRREGTDHHSQFEGIGSLPYVDSNNNA